MSEFDDDPDYVTEDELMDLGTDPALVRVLCPWAVEMTGHDGRRCWLAADLVSLEHGGRP